MDGYTQQTNYYHENNSCLWIDNGNENIVYIGGKKLVMINYETWDILNFVI